MSTHPFDSFLEKPGFLKALPFLAVYAVYLVGMFLDVMDVDAAQYASISREILETGNYLQLFNRHQDYLDKPPLLFWLSSLSFKVFGVSNFSYRLPSVLISLLGTYATYGLAKLYYGRATAYFSALLTASCQAFFLFNHDVRTDTILTGSVIFALWRLALFLQQGRLINLLLGFTGVAAAMLSKGPIGLMVPVLAFSTHFALKREWQNFLRPHWLIGILWLALLLLPMSIGLYQQFDLHPEKVMYGRSGTSGLRFFFWTQSFGRLTGENVWRNDADFFFLSHTLLWAFLPWCLLFVAALFREIVSLVKLRFRIPTEGEAITLGGFVLPYLALSTSQYQLPHYIFVVLPLAATLTGKYLHSILSAAEERAFRIWSWVQLFVVAVIWLAAGLLVTISFPMESVLCWVVAAALLGLCLWLFFGGKSRFSRLVLPSLTAIVGVNFLLNSQVYPALFHYQSPSMVAKYVLSHGFDPQDLYSYNIQAHSLDFTSRRIVPQLTDLGELPARGRFWIYTNTAGLAAAADKGLSPKVIRELPHFHVSMLTLPFLNPNTRRKVVETRYLIQVTR